MNDIELSIDTTYRCLFSCPFCSSSDSSVPRDISFNVANKCLEFAYKFYNSKYHHVEITITGGEPLLLDKLPLLVALWSDKQKENTINLCTTAALDVGTKYWRELSVCGLQSIHLSLLAILEENCQFIFGEKYSFSTVDKNIGLILDAGITLNANFLVSRISLRNIDEICKYCTKRGIKKVRLLGLSKQGRAIKNWDQLSISDKESLAIVKYASELSIKRGISVEFAGLPNHRWCTHSDENGRCLGGKSFFHINTNGDIYPCPSVKSIKSKKIGSVLCPQGIGLRQNFFDCLLKGDILINK